MRNYESLKKTLKGKKGYLFLINDSSCEIRQHFDLSYENNFNADFFIKKFNLKKIYCNERDIRYFFFIIPDKSLVCKDLLPFNVEITKRNNDLIKNLSPDFIDKLDHNCYFKSDSHINYLGGKELSYCFLNYFDNDFKREYLEKLIDKQIIITDFIHKGDLTSEMNWSYSEEEKKDYVNEKIIAFRNKSIESITESIPASFKSCGKRETEYWKNVNGFTDLRVLILRDSSMYSLRNVISTYFKEILLYWDHWSFNQELIEWYKPDIILEIKTERFLENMEDFINNMELK